MPVSGFARGLAKIVAILRKLKPHRRGDELIAAKRGDELIAAKLPGCHAGKAFENL